jgi:hypothetical protein
MVVFSAQIFLELNAVSSAASYTVHSAALGKAWTEARIVKTGIYNF